MPMPRSVRSNSTSVQVRMVAMPELLDAPEVDRARAAERAVDAVALVEQQLGEVGAVLAGDAGDDCSFHEEAPLCAA